MAVENLITEHIDIWTSAVKTRSTSGRGSSKKLELYGIKKLRKLILELAVHGKLVPQDPNDEPADILVQRIMAKKKELLADGTLKKAKKSKVHDAIISAEELPLGWVAADFGDITFNLDAQRIPLSVSERKGRQGIYDYYGASGVIDSIDAYLFDKPLLLIGEDGANLVNRSTPIAFMARGKYWVNNHAHVIDGISEDFLIYLSLYINSISLIPYITGMAQPKMNQAKMNSILVLLPPEKEQHRIVAKVDELMTLCDQLEQQTEASIEAHQVLLTTLLDTLTNSADANELMQNWARISEHFDTLFTTEESIDQLKQTILQLAVMGKLVPQDPTDEPAAELLKRIAEEKAQLVKEKKIKKHPAVEPIGELGDIPQSWERIVVQDFADIKLGSTPSRHESKYWNGDIPWVSSGEVANNIIYDTNEKITHDGFMNSSTSIIPKRSLLMAIIGQGKTRGQTALLEVDACTNQNVAAFIFNENFVIPEYVWLWAKSKYDAHRQGGHGGAQPALNAKKVRSFAFPLPPTSEQKKIVERVEEIHSVCDHLAARLKEGQNTQIQLTDAIVGQVM
ncbi:restriction endonuclease subunit S [Vibrio parahaemolyticus]|uniref:restriction endonuclease subunit S n=1 Tax=Vibrio parahaemolyticus TaxID=670 RepID=UPI00215C80DE|nr:restriction endonuclease subunit S [Vibrio parahaemolyticus]MCR9693430.1 restriction endonuclease subunit S [Vibrio parahaemolyticus]MCR9763620.1 restriction endonuclease subunit S [Vibrio parahaemolyticus]MDF4932711.1 restriction endonuclease subunit S [Vibrio parahaemolyticus]MDG2762118.1 restriction endonuclease subunit S [Vibrio parahaemolyticus]